MIQCTRLPSLALRHVYSIFIQNPFWHSVHMCVLYFQCVRKRSLVYDTVYVLSHGHTWGSTHCKKTRIKAMISLLSRVIWMTWVSCSCKAPSTCGQTTRKVTTKSRTWHASSPCRGTSSCTIRWFCSAKSVRKTQTAMRNLRATVSSILLRCGLKGCSCLES